ncbi:hypothetical protein AB8Z56_09060 [Klebsiella pneumoniae subsp. pneumoniae]|uniref:hypothetical protein n=1 Tax=Klebsiella pneumoniae TaxID=573 RepID=UPI0035115219
MKNFAMTFVWNIFVKLITVFITIGEKLSFVSASLKDDLSFDTRRLKEDITYDLKEFVYTMSYCFNSFLMVNNLKTNEKADLQTFNILTSLFNGYNIFSKSYSFTSTFLS